jgi:hypothetical protein
MALRIIIGADPGASGALMTLIDGEPGPMLDMPSKPQGEKTVVDAEKIARWVRMLRSAHPGAAVQACVEAVSAAPMEGRRQGSTSMFNFGVGFGKLLATFEVLGVPCRLVQPRVWKGRMGLLKTEKDATRLWAIKRFPCMADVLKRKKDSGRADALAIALWAESQL